MNIDAELAEKVMGKLPLPSSDEMMPIAELHKYHIPELFRPSQDISAAMEVVEKLGEKFQISMNWLPVHEEWKVSVFSGFKRVAGITAKTLPLAISKAALEAVKEKT